MQLSVQATSTCPAGTRWGGRRPPRCATSRQSRWRAKAGGSPPGWFLSSRALLRFGSHLANGKHLHNFVEFHNRDNSTFWSNFHVVVDLFWAETTLAIIEDSGQSSAPRPTWHQVYAPSIENSGRTSSAGKMDLDSARSRQHHWNTRCEGPTQIKALQEWI